MAGYLAGDDEEINMTSEVHRQKQSDKTMDDWNALFSRHYQQRGINVTFPTVFFTGLLRSSSAFLVSLLP